MILYWLSGVCTPPLDDVVVDGGVRGIFREALSQVYISSILLLLPFGLSCPLSKQRNPVGVWKSACDRYDGSINGTALPVLVS